MTRSKNSSAMPKPTTNRMLGLVRALAKQMFGKVAVPAEDLEALWVAPPPQFPTQRWPHCLPRLVHRTASHRLDVIDGEEGPFGLTTASALPAIGSQNFIPQTAQRLLPRLSKGSATDIAIAALGLRLAAHALAATLACGSAILRRCTFMNAASVALRARKVFS